MPDGVSGTPAAKTEYRDLPIIDLGPFLKSGGDEPGTLPEEIRHACENIGFFFIVNHGVSEDLLKRIFEQTEALSRFAVGCENRIEYQYEPARLYCTQSHHGPALHL